MLMVMGGVSWPRIGVFASAVRGPLAGLALVVTMAVIGLPAGGGPSLSTAMESIRLRPSAGVSAALEADLHWASRANDDGYLDGLTEAPDAAR
jgi:hypothetical protein